jgi:hypothetical protein
MNDSASPAPDPSSRIRRRRSRRLIVPADAEGRAALLAALARRAYPSYELFVFALLCGSILGAAYILDSQALLLAGILTAPLLTPWIGMLLAMLTGSPRFFLETFTALVVSAVLVFLSGLLAGFAARLFLPRTFNEAFIHSRLWIPDLVVLAVGAIVFTIAFVRSEEKPFLPSLILAYELFLPLSAAGFGLGSGVEGLWPAGALVFLIHFAWAAVFGLVTLAALRFVPMNASGAAASGLAAVGMIVLLVFLMGGNTWTPETAAEAPTSTVTPGFSLVPVSPGTMTVAAAFTQAAGQPSPTPLIATATPGTQAATNLVALTVEVTLPPSETPTPTLTIEPTPVYARILSKEGGGAFLRKTPNGKFLATLENYTIVELLPDVQEVNGVTWAHVLATKNGIKLDGWVLQTVLDVATPVPNWQPSATPTIVPGP